MKFCVTLENDKSTLSVDYDRGKYASNYKIRQEEIVSLFENQYSIKVEKIETYGALTNKTSHVTLEIVLDNSTINKLKKTTCNLKDLRSSPKKETKKRPPLKSQANQIQKNTSATPSSKRGKSALTDTN
tara:strand:- start:721 stop:1107 length:387 start_codon:yes stop_codon:yes gene_type:complete